MLNLQIPHQSIFGYEPDMQHPSPRTTLFQVLLDQGDEEAYAELLSAASDRLLKLARRMLRGFPRLQQWEQTDDVFQSAVLRLHQSLTEVRPESVRQFFGLAATQIRRTLLDLARHHYGPEGVAVNHEQNPDFDPADPFEAPESLLHWAEFHRQVMEMPDVERETFDLLWYSGMTQQDAAILLEVSERTVMRRYCRARLYLQQVLYTDK